MKSYKSHFATTRASKHLSVHLSSSRAPHPRPQCSALVPSSNNPCKARAETQPRISQHSPVQLSSAPQLLQGLWLLQTKWNQTKSASDLFSTRAKQNTSSQQLSKPRLNTKITFQTDFSTAAFKRQPTNNYTNSN